MTFKQIQDAVLADAFAESKRSDAKNWIRFRHAWLWDLDEWTFKFDTVDLEFTDGSQTITLPDDFQEAVAVFDARGRALDATADFRSFFRDANVRQQLSAGTPSRYTVLASKMFIDCLGDGTTGLLVYQRSKPDLVADNDPTGLPEGYDLALVHGGKAEGFKLSNVPLAQGFDDDFSAAATAMQKSYLSQVREQGQQLGAYIPGFG